MRSNSSSSTIIKNALANYGGFFFQLVIAFFLSPFLVHHLGDTKYGIWSIVAALSGYMCLMDLGISSAMTKYVARYKETGEKEQSDIIIHSGFALYLSVAFLIIIVSPITANLFIKFIKFDPSLVKIVHALVIITSFDVAFFLVAGTFRGVFQGVQRYDTINFILIITGAIKALCFFLLLSMGYGLLTMGIITLAEKIITIMIFYSLMKKTIGLKFCIKKITKSGIATILSFSFFTFLNMIANQIIYYSDSFVIGYFASAAAVTYYTIAWSLMEYVKKFCLSFSRVFIPVFSEIEATRDYNKIQQYYINGSKYTLIISCLFCIGLIIFGKSFINLWMGGKYGLICAPILICLVVSQFIELPHLVSLAVLLGIARHKYMSYVSLLTGIINVVLSIILIRYYGLIGVAIGTTAPQIFVYGTFMFFYTNYCIGLSRWSYIKGVYVPIVFPGLLMVGAGLICQRYIHPDNYLLLILDACICAAVFLTAAFFTSLSKAEQEDAGRYMIRLKSKLNLAYGSVK